VALFGGTVLVGIGFGLKNIIANFVSSIVILLERILKVGDFVALQSGERGHVRDIELRHTRVTTNGDFDIIVPKSDFVSGRVTNWTYHDHRHHLHIPLGVAYAFDKKRVKTAAIIFSSLRPIRRLQMPMTKTRLHERTQHRRIAPIR
jgi:small-conductance mechanosensitive channel